MNITLAALAAEAIDRWRRDRTVLLALAGAFLFLPLFGWLLLLEPPVPKPDMTRTEVLNLALAWIGANVHWLAARVGVELFGYLTILALYLSRAHRDVADLLRVAVGLFPAFAAAVLLTWVLAGVGFSFFFLPGMYVYGRLGLTGAVLAAEPGVGVFGAIGRSVALTDRRGWLTFGYLALPFLMGLIAAELIGAVAAGMTKAGAVNPIAVAILDALAAAAVAIAALVRLLFEVALYRRLAAKVR